MLAGRVLRVQTANDFTQESYVRCWPSSSTIKDTTTDFVGVIDASDLADPLPPWQLRVCPRFIQLAS